MKLCIFYFEVELKRKILQSLFGEVFPIINYLIFIPLLMSRMTSELFSSFLLVQVFIGVSGLFDLGLSKTTTYIIAKGIDKRQPETVSSAIIAAAIIGLAISVLYSAYLFLSKQDIAEFGLILPFVFMIVSPLSTVAPVLKGIVEGVGRFDISFIFKVILTLSGITIPALVYILTYSYEYCLAALLISRVVSLCILFFLVNKIHSLKIRNGLTIQGVRSLFCFGKWITLSNVISPFLSRIDQLLISPLVGALNFSIYSTAIETVSKYNILSNSMSNVLFFGQSAARDGSNEISNSYDNSILVLITGGTLIFLLFQFFGESIISIWIDRDFASKAVSVYSIILAGVIVNSIARVDLSILQARDQSKFAAINHAFQAIVYVPIVLFLAAYKGVSFVAACWSLRMCIDQLFLALKVRGYISKLKIHTLKLAFSLSMICYTLLMIANIEI